MSIQDLYAHARQEEPFNTYRVRALFTEVEDERFRQHVLFGSQHHLPHLAWLPILTEEVGECARCLCEGWESDLRDELIQVAAVALAWVESIDRNKQEG